MTCKINADTSDGLKIVSDTSGAVDIQSNGTTKVTIDANGNVNTVGQVSTTDNGTIVTRQNAKPLVINGDMQVAQRETSLTGQTGSGFCLDRFGFQMGNFGTWTMTQADDGPTGSGFTHALKWDCTTADTSLGAGDFGLAHYRIEGQDLQLLKKGTSSAEKVTISFWVKSAKTGTYILELYDVDNSRHISQAYTISSADTWEQKVLVFAGDTTGALGNDNGNSLAISWWLGAGSTYNSATLQTSWGANDTDARATGVVNLADSTDNDWYLTGVQLEVGEFDSTTMPSFQHESFDENLKRCERYYEKTLNYSLHAGDTCTTSSGNWQSVLINTNDFYDFGYAQFRTRKRAAPTITTYSYATGASGKGRMQDAADITMNANETAETQTRFNTSSTGSASNYVRCYYTAESEL